MLLVMMNYRGHFPSDLVEYPFSAIDSFFEILLNFNAKRLRTPVARCWLKSNSFSINSRYETVAKYATRFSITLKPDAKQETRPGSWATKAAGPIAPPEGITSTKLVDYHDSMLHRIDKSKLT
jgi:hypothetical protein